MIRAPTTLILGAGASWDYGYPLGYELLLQIRQLKDDHPVARTANALFEPGLFARFSRRLNGGEYSSIDHFLGLRHLSENEKAIGKLAVAHLMNEYHFQSGALRSGSSGVIGEHWHALLWHALDRDVYEIDDFFENRLSIVTFNYDLSVEFFLIRQFRNKWPDISRADVKALLDHLRIVHVYGEIGDAMDYYFDPPEQGIDALSEVVRASADRLKVIPEARGSELQTFAQARSLVDEAERVGFFGFSFDSDNLRQLDLTTILNAKMRSRNRLVASTFGMTVAEVNNAFQRIAPRNILATYDGTVRKALLHFGILMEHLLVHEIPNIEYFTDQGLKKTS